MADESAAKAADGTQPGQAAGDGGIATPKTFVQEEVDRIVAKTRREEEKRFSEAIQKAKQFDELQGKQKEKEDADKSELQKLQEEKARLTAESEHGKKLQETLDKILTKKLESIPEDKRSLVEELRGKLSSEDLLEWIEAHGEILFGKQAGGPFAPPGGKPPAGPADPDRVRAENIVKMGYGPKDPIWKDAARLEAKIADTLEQMKRQAKPATPPV
jgi:hypothetical protein